MMYAVEVRFKEKFWPLVGHFDYMRALNVALHYGERGVDARVVPL